MAEQMAAAQEQSTTAEEAARAAISPNAPPPGIPGESAKPAAQSDKDPMRELLDRMERLQPVLANVDPSLAKTMQSLTRQGTDPERLAQAGFRHQVAYALQDLEKSPIGAIAIAPELRSEMTHLAGTAPGLENERMQALMRATAALQDNALIRDIRNAGNDIGRQAGQGSADTQSRIDVLENKVRLTQRSAEHQHSPEAVDGAAQGRTATGEQTFADPGATAPDRPTADDRVHAARRFDGAARDDAGPAARGQRAQAVYPRSILDTVLAGIRPREQGSGAPWDPTPTPMAERLTAFERKMQEGADERAFVRVEKSARAALEALQAFSAGEGARMMARIREAARTEPGGMAAVLSEMREGGRFSDLRQQFNNALETERGAAGAYDKAAAALGRYAQDRTAAQDIIGRRPDADALTARFEQVDARIGEAAASTPSRKDGKSMVDDLAQKAAELLHRAVEAVKSVFSRSPSAEATARPAPSPSMSA